MDVKDVCEGCMVEFGNNGLGGTIGEPEERDGVMSVQVWPADNGSTYGPGKIWMPVADLQPANMDRWLYLVEGNAQGHHWVAKKPGVLIAEDAPST